MRHRRGGEENVGYTEKTEGEKKKGDRGQEVKMERKGKKMERGMAGMEQMKSS